MMTSWRNSSFVLGWSQLSHGRSRMIVALVGVSVTVLLMLIMLSIRDMVIQSSLHVPASLKGDLIVLSPRTQSLMRAAPFPRRFLNRLQGINAVDRVSAVYVENARWVNPWTKQEHLIRVYGMELTEDILGLTGIDPSDPALRTADTAIFDRLSRPNFGPVVQEVLAERPVSVEVNGRRITVCGVTLAGITVGVDGNLFTTHANFQRLFPGPTAAACNIGVVRLQPGFDSQRVREIAQQILGTEARVLTRERMIEEERDYMRKNDPVDFLMNMIAGVAFFVGMIIVYQILYSDVVAHLAQFATLKAIGFGNGFLLRIIISEGVILSLIGFGPGLGAAHVLTRLTGNVIQLPVEITADRVVVALALTVAMCVIAAAAAVRKLTQADPADVF